jgi:hypothetical protein
MAYKYLKPYTSFFENVTIYKRYFEFVVAEISQLKNYLNMSPLDKGKDLLYHHSHIIDQYLDWILSKARELEDDKMVSLIDDYEWDNVVVRLLSKKEYHEVADDILGGVYVHARSFDIPDEELPSWWFFDDPQIIKNQWLIHFTNKNPIDIQKQGFQRLESDITHLGL